MTIQMPFASFRRRQMTLMASRISRQWNVCSTFFRLTTEKHQNSVLLSLCEGWPVYSPHKGTVMLKMFPFDDVIICIHRNSHRCACKCPNTQRQPAGTVQGWGLLSQFPPFLYFLHFSPLSKPGLCVKYRVYIWQVSPQLSCGDACQI